MFDSLSGGWGQQALDVADFGVLVMNEQGVQWLNPYLLSLLQQEEIQDSTTFKSSELTSLLLSAGNPFPVPPQQTQQRWLRREHI